MEIAVKMIVSMIMMGVGLGISIMGFIGMMNTLKIIGPLVD